MKPIRVLFLPQLKPNHPNYDEFCKAIGDKHNVARFDAAKPLAEQFEGVQVVVDDGGARHTREMIDVSVEKGVKMWHVTTNGLDHVDVKYFFEKGMPLSHAQGPQSAIALAEHALLIVLYFAKNLHRNQGKKWHARVVNLELEGQVLGLVGFGASARELARRAGCLGMRVMAVDVVDVPTNVLAEYRVEFFGDPSQMERLLSESDFISIHTPLTSKTRHMLDRRAFAKMKRNAVVINVARGEIIEEMALVEALQNGRIKGAGLDVFATEPLPQNHPLLQMPNVVATPHIAGVTTGTFRRRAQAAAENVDRTAQGLPPLYRVMSVE